MTAPCQKGAFLAHAIEVQSAALPASITTVRMLLDEQAGHRAGCDACRQPRWNRVREITADAWKDYGDISSVPPPYAVAMECARCRVRWRGCADVFECPECGDGEPPWMPAEERADRYPGWADELRHELRPRTSSDTEDP